MMAVGFPQTMWLVSGCVLCVNLLKILGGIFTMDVAADGGAQVTVQLLIEISFSKKEHTV